MPNIFCSLYSVIINQHKSHLLPIPSTNDRNQENIWRAFQSLFSAGLHTSGNNDKDEKPPIYIITPTWPRPVQIAELTRLGYVLKVSNYQIDK